MLRLGFLLPLSFLQFTVLPALSLSALDLFTLYAVILSVLSRMQHTLLIVGMMALILETQLLVPAGTYFCSYWMIIVLIHLLKNITAWHLTTPWLFAFTTAKLLLVVMETCALTPTSENIGSYLLQSALRIFVIGIAGGFFVLILRRSAFRFSNRGMRANSF